jgi:hypothetical protein
MPGLARYLAAQSTKSAGRVVPTARCGGVGDVSAASQVAAESCVVGPWTDSVKSVLLLDSSAYNELARTLRKWQ